MAISLFVLLMCSLAVDGVTGRISPRIRMGIPDRATANVPLRGSDEVDSDVAFTLCGDKGNHCAAFGHSV